MIDPTVTREPYASRRARDQNDEDGFSVGSVINSPVSRFVFRHWPMVDPLGYPENSRFNR